MSLTLPPDFGHWFAGLVDGEGSFVIGRRATKRGAIGLQPRFIIGLRIDDEATLQFVRSQLGMGIVRHYPAPNGRTPMAYFRIDRNADALTLLEIFDRYPLRSKKARDLVIYREAVLEKAKGLGGGSTARLLELKRILETGRRLSADSSLFALPDDPQLRIGMVS